eukprot:152129-Chlamydomonas_euryale.AAC.3
MTGYRSLWIGLCCKWARNEAARWSHPERRLLRLLACQSSRRSRGIKGRCWGAGPWNTLHRGGSRQGRGTRYTGEGLVKAGHRGMLLSCMDLGQSDPLLQIMVSIVLKAYVHAD